MKGEEKETEQRGEGRNEREMNNIPVVADVNLPPVKTR